MMKRVVPLSLLLVFWASLLLAQRFSGRWGGGEGGIPEDAPIRTAREVPTHSTDFPRWTNPPDFETDVFTFARVRYFRRPYAPRRAGYCFIDFPDCDLDLSYRLQQITSLKVDPDGRVLSLSDPDLFAYPWIYMVEPGALRFEEEEVQPLRKYLLNGGFLMADDFWGPVEWDNFESEMKRVLPEKEFIELPMEHPIFHSVFDLQKSKNELQVPNILTGHQSQHTGVTWEYHDGVQCRDVHIRALFDDKGRMMVIACHNTDNGDGWEREQESEYFFREFSEKRAYPLGINIIFYAMTH
ncbi:MAG: DUF4159 domain-containing protein [Verrucomicrobiales bacterium]|nr:DUF4159 domain-containing protein [Verrucomicrobiales bacterium]